MTMEKLFVTYRIQLLCLAALLPIGLAAGAGDYSVDSTLSQDISFYQAPQSSEMMPAIDGGTVDKVILCIGDGMGVNQIALARSKAVGANKRLWMEILPTTGTVRTLSANKAITDSAAAGTAMACGIKTNNGVLGIDPNGKAYHSILELAAQQGWRTGLVVTCTVSHATPAAFASHVGSRGSEADIAAQMREAKVDVLFGGGRKFWLPKGAKGSDRSDTQDLLELARRDGYQVIESRQQMMQLTYGPVIGLFALDAMTTAASEPMLDEMAAKAISLLSKKADWFAPKPRFFLMIEGSQIDWAGHANDTAGSIRQTLLFDMAVREAIEFAKKDKRTLLIVTADHETGGLMLDDDKDNPGQLAARWTSKGHTGVDVPLFAYGPGSQQFAGTIDNTDIAKKIAGLMSIKPFPVPMEETAVKTETLQTVP